MLVDDLLDAAGLRRAHERLLREHGDALSRLRRRADRCSTRSTPPRLLDEVFLTITPFVVDESAHEGVVKIFDFEAVGATLVAEGRTAADESWLFRRWRFSPR